MSEARIETRRDEVRHGVFYTTYVVYDHHGFWCGDYSTWDRANEKLKEIK